MHIIKVNYAINRIHEIAFRSELSTQIKNLSLDELLFPVIYLYLVDFLDFFYDSFLFPGFGVN